MRMISIRIRNVRIQLELWRLVGLASSVVGLLCYALSPSFKRLIGGWNSFKFILYGVLVLFICTTILFAKQCSLTRHGKLKVHVGFAVLMLTSVYSFLYDKAMNGKPDVLSMVSNAAFSLMSLSLSRLVKLGFEVGLFSFFLGCLAVQLMTINLMLILVAIIYGYPLFLMHSSSDSQPEVGSGDDERVVVLDTDTLSKEAIRNYLRESKMFRPEVDGGDHQHIVVDNEDTLSKESIWTNSESEIFLPENIWTRTLRKRAIWTTSENKLFENALAFYDKDTPDRWLKISAMIPGKTVDEVISQYKLLKEDLSEIEAGLIPIPGYTKMHLN